MTLDVDGKKLLRHCHTDGSYLSASDSRLLFGIRSGAKVGKVEVAWPDGSQERFVAPVPGTYATLLQGKGKE